MLYDCLARRLRSFDELAPDDILAISKMVSRKPRRIPPRQNVFDQGADRRGRVLYLSSGWLCRYKSLTDGRVQMISYVLPGDVCLSEAWLPDCDFAMRTITECVIFEFDRDHFLEVFHARPALARALQSAILFEAVTGREWILSLGQRTAVERCAHLICELHSRLQSVGLATNRSMEFPLTQEEIASTIGVSTVHANRVLQTLRAAGQIEFANRKTLEILDLNGLREKACLGPEPVFTKQTPAPLPNAIYPRMKSNVISFPWHLNGDVRSAT